MTRSRHPDLDKSRQLDLDSFAKKEPDSSPAAIRKAPGKKKVQGLQVVYEPKGKAAEYSGLAANLYRGCDHECIYCYGPQTLHIPREEFCHPVPKSDDVISKFREDCRILEAKGEKRYILLSFVADPYCLLDSSLKITRQVLEILANTDLRFTILTKGGVRSMRDFDILERCKDRCEYAATLTLSDEGMRMVWEPHAAPTHERITALMQAHAMGIRTWVSMEPVIDQEQTFELIRKVAGFVDEIRVGKMNYHELARQIDWKRFGDQVVELLEELGVKYMIKADLKRAMGMDGNSDEVAP